MMYCDFLDYGMTGMSYNVGANLCVRPNQVLLQGIPACLTCGKTD